jgi:hypothetical protein
MDRPNPKSLEIAMYLNQLMNQPTQARVNPMTVASNPKYTEKTQAEFSPP